MDAMTIGVDLAKNTFEVVMRPGVAGSMTRRRFTRSQFERFLRSHRPAHVVMEACGTAHHWARVAQSCGHRGLAAAAPGGPAVCQFSSQDRSHRCCGLLEAVRNPRIHPVVPKTVAQQELLGLHRIRRQWMTSRTARINAVRGFLQELGLPIARGAHTACVTAAARLADPATPIPARLRTMLELLLVEVRDLEARVQMIDRQLAQSPPPTPWCNGSCGFPASGC